MCGSIVVQSPLNVDNRNILIGMMLKSLIYKGFARSVELLDL